MTDKSIEELKAEYRRVFGEYYSRDSQMQAEDIIAQLQSLATRIGWHDVYQIIDEGYWGNELDAEELMPQIQRDWD